MVSGVRMFFYASSGIVGAGVGGLFAAREFTKSKDTQLERIGKVALGALAGSVVFGTMAIGISVLSKGRVFIAILIIASLGLKVLAMQQESGRHL